MYIYVFCLVSLPRLLNVIESANPCHMRVSLLQQSRSRVTVDMAANMVVRLQQARRLPPRGDNGVAGGGGGGGTGSGGGGGTADGGLLLMPSQQSVVPAR